MNKDQDGYSALTEYIKNQMESGTSVDKSIAQIKLALKFNIVPNDAFQEVLRVPFEELYNKIKLIAHDKGYAIIETEQAELYCKSIYEALKK